MVWLPDKADPPGCERKRKERKSFGWAKRKKKEGKRAGPREKNGPRKENEAGPKEKEMAQKKRMVAQRKIFEFKKRLK